MPQADIQLISDSLTVKCELIIFTSKNETVEQLLNRKNDFLKNLNRHINKMGLIREIKNEVVT